MVRQDLGRLEGVASISREPDDATATAELQTVDGQLIEPSRFAMQLQHARVGARLRGLEVTVDGRLERAGKSILLRLRRHTDPLPLSPLTIKVQKQPGSSKSQPATRTEKRALASLRKEWNGTPRLARITGPIITDPRTGKLTLQVRVFDLNPPTLE